MPTCGKCAEPFGDHLSINGITLTRVCEGCLVSTQLLTKTSAISLGARVEDLDRLDHRREPNPYYRNAVSTYLFLEEEVKCVAGIANAARERRECARKCKEEIQTRAKRMKHDGRARCLEKRIQTATSKIKTVGPPTPGLVSGDFCTSATKTPKISVAKLAKRVAIWRSLNSFSLSHRVNLFRFGCANELYTFSREEIESSAQNVHHSLDRVVLSEGNRVLQFLTPMERLHATRAVQSMHQELHGLPVSAMSDDMYALCQYTSVKLEQMRSTHPVKRKRLFGSSTRALWNDVYEFLLSRSGHVIPTRIGFYGVSRVFDMLCREAVHGTRSGNVYNCFARLGMPSPPHRFLQTLSGKYIGNARLMDFQMVGETIRVFCDGLMSGVDIPRRFDLLLEEMGKMVYLEGKTWTQAADDAARSITSADPVLPGLCFCGYPAAMKCVRNRCRTCCRSNDSAVACPRHNNAS
ncbi:unnamed protein product [Ectocarpus sp. 8 AP-2014]